MSVVPLSGISQVASRIAAIESRVQPAAARPTATASASSTASVEGMSAPGGVANLGAAATFDAFGDTYQQALDALGLDGLDAIGLDAAGASVLGATGGYGTYASFAQCGSYGGVNGVTAASTPSAAAEGPSVQQIAAAVRGEAGPPGVRPVGGYGSLSVPAELAGFGNGRIPADALTPLAAQPGHRLAEPAAASWNALVEAAAADGIDMTITDSYRSYDAQVDLAARKGLYSQGGYAATPGRSNHGWGLAVDVNVNDSATHAWLAENGPRFGWVEAVPREPWHWEFRPNQV